MRSVAVAGLFAVLLTACGSDNGGSTDTSEPVGDGDAAIEDEQSAGQAPDDAQEGQEDAAEAEGDEPVAGGSMECAATDARLPDASDRDLVALIPIPDGLTDSGDTFEAPLAVSGHTNSEVDPHGAVDCVEQLIDDLGWELVSTSEAGSIDTPGGHTFAATHADLPDYCLSASLFASAHTTVVAGDEGTRAEMSLRELPEGVECQF